MSLNIQTSTGLLEIGGNVTEEKIISALGYEPANKTHIEDTTVHITSEERKKWNVKADQTDLDAFKDEIKESIENSITTMEVHTKSIELNGEDLGSRLDSLESVSLPNILDNESGELTIADENGNTIAKIDSNGLETTTVTAKNAVIDGVDVGIKFDEQKESINNISEDLSTHISDTDIHISSNERSQWNETVENLNTHINDKVVHITSDERTTWNNKSDSGHTHDFEEITNSPIAEDSSGELTIADENGNTIAKIDSNGLETTTVTAKNAVIDGVDVGIKFDELDSLIGDKSVNIQISEAISAENLSQYATDIDLSNHTSDEIIHITDDERNAWNAAKINVTTAQSKADSAYALAESKVDSLSDLGITATATELNKLDGVTVTTAELNFIDGVTSNIQTQLNNKLTYNVVTTLPSTGTNGTLYVIK